MRIISGIYKGRKINPPANLAVRPTTDMAKEAIFNITANVFDIEHISVLDLFSGTGNISFEFASRGCSRVDAVDENITCVSFIIKTAALLNLDMINIYHDDVFMFLQKRTVKYDLIFADPPFSMNGIRTIPGIIFDRNLLKKDGWLVVEHGRETDFSDEKNFFMLRKYGNVNFSIFTP